MQKTKLGVPVGLLAAMLFFISVFSGYTGLLLLGGYILLFEENTWLKKMVIKVVALSVVFSILFAFLNFLPNIITVIDNIVSFFSITYKVSLTSTMFYNIIIILTKVQDVIFIILGIKAMKGETIALKEIDDLAEKSIEE